MWQKQEGDRDFSEDIREAGNTYVVYMKELMVGNRKQSRISMKLWKSSGPKYIDAVERQEKMGGLLLLFHCMLRTIAMEMSIVHWQVRERQAGN